MPEFKKPKVLTKSEKIISEKGDVLMTSVIEYNVDGKLYPKLQISVYKQDEDGFPTARPKTLNLPVDMKLDLIKSLNSQVEVQ